MVEPKGDLLKQRSAVKEKDTKAGVPLSIRYRGGGGKTVDYVEHTTGIELESELLSTQKKNRRDLTSCRHMGRHGKEVSESC